MGVIAGINLVLKVVKDIRGLVPADIKADGEWKALLGKIEDFQQALERAASRIEGMAAATAAARELPSYQRLARFLQDAEAKMCIVQAELRVKHGKKWNTATLIFLKVVFNPDADDATCISLEDR